MSRSLNLSLTDELRSFVDENSGDGTMFATPSEFVRAILRETKDRGDASALRASVLDGYQDITEGRVVEYKGSIRSAIKESHRRDKSGWQT